MVMATRRTCEGRNVTAELTVAKAAESAGVTPTTVRNWIRRGHISRNQAGLIDQAALLAWWDRRDTRKVRDKRSL